MQAANFEQALEAILQKDARYHCESYHFVREALDFTQKMVGKMKPDEIRHVSGQQLLDGIRKYALEQFGPMSLYLLHEWGLRTCEDFGEIVFNLVEQGVLKKTEKDTRADFQNGYDFQEAFGSPFVPRTKPDRPVASSPHPRA